MGFMKISLKEITNSNSREFFTILFFIFLITTLSYVISTKMIRYAAAETNIPEWIKNIFIWYGQGTVSESELLQALQYLVENKFLILDFDYQEDTSRGDFDFSEPTSTSQYSYRGAPPLSQNSNVTIAPSNDDVYSTGTTQGNNFNTGQPETSSEQNIPSQQMQEEDMYSTGQTTPSAYSQSSKPSANPGDFGYSTGQVRPIEIIEKPSVNPEDFGYTTGKQTQTLQASAPTILNVQEISTKAQSVWDNMFKYVDDKKSINIPKSTLISIVSYNVFDDNITDENSQHVPPDLEKLRHDSEKHKELWQTMINLIPEDYRYKIIKFKLATDYKNGAISQVIRDGRNLESWAITIDPIDLYPRKFLEHKALSYIAIHQFGQMLTRDSSQVNIEDLLWELGSFSSDRYDTWYPQKKQDCGTNLMLWDGCTKNDSIINNFYQKFWIDIYPEWEQINSLEDKTKQSQQFEDFAARYADSFVTNYAATSIENDIAESWSAFVLLDRPSENKISDQKINFFYEISELIKLRDEIRNAL